MTTSYVHQIRLCKWFPADDRFATNVARLCVLREDFYIEMMGLYVAKLGKLDGHSKINRQMYFWRNLVRTLSEISSTLDVLNTVPSFRTALGKQSPAEQKQFARMVKQLAVDRPLVKRVRDALGGHVLEKGIAGVTHYAQRFVQLHGCRQTSR